MIRSLILALVLSLGLAGVAHAGDDFFDLTQPKLIMDDCTDIYSEPETTFGDVTALTQVDAWNEALNPDVNRGNPPQTSGSADGWCDANPWVFSGNWSFSASEDVYFGPIRVPDDGVMFSNVMSSIGDDWGVDFVQDVSSFPEWTSATTLKVLYASSGSSSTIITSTLWSPNHTENATGVVAMPTGPLPKGTDIFLRLDLNGTGGPNAWTMIMGVHPVSQSNPSRR